jgi:hypothetical protein
MFPQLHFGVLLYSVAIVFSSLYSSGCSDSYRPSTQVTPPPGTGATGGGAVGSATAGRPAGRAGSSAPLPSAGAVAPVPRAGGGGSASAGSGAVDPVGFGVRLDGRSVILDVKSPLVAYYQTCTDAMVLQKLDVATGSWVRPIDQRPPSHNNPGYYLDGRYVQPSFSEGCDIVSCQNFGSTNFVASAAEYVQVGVIEVISGGVPVYVPSIETRPLVGSARVVVEYTFRDPMCSTPMTRTLTINLPASDGVCCAIGSPGCGTMGPVGGWAIDYASCRPFFPAPDTYFREAVDSHGCPYLIEDFNRCCGCEDAGVEE